MRLQILFSFISNNAVLDVNLRSVQLCASYLAALAIVFTLPCFPLPCDSPPYVTCHVTEKSELSAVSVNFALLLQFLNPFEDKY